MFHKPTISPDPEGVRKRQRDLAVLVNGTLSQACTTCKKVQPIESFYTGHRRCLRCRSKRERDKQADLFKKFGLTPEGYKALNESQGGLCAICRKTCSTENRLSVDHDHDTGKMRGLLCRRCNLGLGHFKDNVGRLDMAIKYLQIYAGATFRGTGTDRQPVEEITS